MSTPNKILIVDDDELLSESLVEQFSLCGEFNAQAVTTASAGVMALEGDLFEVAVWCFEHHSAGARRAGRMAILPALARVLMES